MRTLILEGIVTAKTQIAHNGGELNGNQAMFRRMKVVQPGGDYIEIPHISGNSIRGKLRDVGAKQMLDLLGEDGQPKQVKLSTFQLLFSGGTLEKAKKRKQRPPQGQDTEPGRNGGEGADIDKFREMRKNIIHLSLFGGAFNNVILPGKMKINPLIPIAKETTHIIPEQFHGESTKHSVYTYLQLGMYTRKENSQDPEFEPYLKKDESVKFETSQMIYYIESLAAGTPLYWKVVLEDVTPEEFDFIISLIQRFENVPVVGGKSAVGFGQIEMSDCTWRDVTKEGDTLSVVSDTTESLYVKMLSDHKEEINSYLDGV